MSHSYIAAGISILNDIVFADGKKTKGHLGGAIFAYTGMALFTDSVLFLSSGGPDYFEYYRPYFRENGMSEEGISITMPHTHYTLLEYAEDGTWHEDSYYGPTYFIEQSENCRVTFEKLRPFLSEETKGIYLDARAGEPIFDEIAKIRQHAPNVKILWEPPTVSSKDPSLHDAVMYGISQTDYYSMNLDEASSFFGSDGREEVIKRIIDLSIPCFLREGEKGSTWIENGTVTSAPCLHPEEAIDVTGCGNCSSAAALYWRIEGKSYEDIVRNANVAAKYNSLSEGPFAVKKAREERASKQQI